MVGGAEQAQIHDRQPVPVDRQPEQRRATTQDGLVAVDHHIVPQPALDEPA